MTTFHKTNVQPTEATELDAQTWDANAIGDQYMADADAGGYVVNDEAFCRDVIAGLVGIGQWSCFGLLLCGGCAYKGFLTAQPLVLPLRGPAQTPFNVGASPTVGTSGGLPYIDIPDSSCFFRYNMPLHYGAMMGAVIRDEAADTNAGAGLGLKWTADGKLHYFYVGNGSMYVAPGDPAGNARLSGQGAFAFGAGDVATWDADLDAIAARVSKNGAPTVDQSAGATIPGNHTLPGVAYDVDVLPIGGTHRRLTVAGIAVAPYDRNAVGSFVKGL